MGLPLWPCFAVVDIKALPTLPLFISWVVIVLPIVYCHGRDFLAFKFNGAAVWKTSQIGEALTWIRDQIIWIFYQIFHLLYERPEELGKLRFECFEALRGLGVIIFVDRALRKLQESLRLIWASRRNTAEGDGKNKA